MNDAAGISGGTGLIGEADFAEIARLLHAMTGIDLSPSKRAMVSARLIKRIKRLGLASAAAYCALLKASGPAAEAARVEFVSALTTNVTRFGREAHQFAHFESQVLPGLVARLRRGGRVRLWSAGCSSGEEPSDLAFRVLDHCPEAGQLDFRILATDIDQTVLQAARAGLYPRSALEPLSRVHADRYFTPAAGAGPDRLQLSPRVRDLISFRALNLQDDWPFHGLFDTIMCRNVTIYFDTSTQSLLWRRFAAQLVDDGALYIGHSETVTPEIALQFSGEGVSIFRKRAAGSPGRTAPAFAARASAPAPGIER